MHCPLWWNGHVTQRSKRIGDKCQMEHTRINGCIMVGVKGQGVAEGCGYVGEWVICVGGCGRGCLCVGVRSCCVWVGVLSGNGGGVRVCG